MSLFHDRTSRFCKVGKNNRITFVLRAAKDPSAKVFLCVFGEDENAGIEEYKMECTHSTERFSYYECTPFIANSLIRYFFRVENEFATIYYNALGASFEQIGRGDFEFDPNFHTPDWAKGAVMYQIMVDRFANGDTSNDVLTEEYAYIGAGVARIDDWYKIPAVDGTREFYGGDLQGVIDKLGYLKDLGVEVIYFNPLFVSPSNHKYDTQDYDYIDPHIGKIVNDGGGMLTYGEGSNDRAERYRKRTTDLANLEASNQLFIELVERAHKKGIKVVIDGVFNHCGSFNKWLDREGIYRGNKDYKPGAYVDANSPYNSYFKFMENKWPDNYTYEGWWGFDTLPKLNYEESPELCEYILNVARKWVSPPFNADGWRLDVAADLGHSEEFNHEFWKRFRDAVKSANPDAIILAEHYGNANSWLKGDQWDSVMNYDAFMDPVTWFLTGVDKHSDNANRDMIGNAGAFAHTMNEQLALMQNESLFVAMNELSNHDHSRFLTRTNKRTGRIGTVGGKAASEGIDYNIFRQAVVMQMTLPGAPTIYYGDEAGLCGWTDPDNRRTYPWGRENGDLIAFHKKVIRIHKRYRVLKEGSYMTLNVDKDLLCYGRFHNSSGAVVAINTSDESKHIRIPVWRLGVPKKSYGKVIETKVDKYFVAESTKDATKTYVVGGNLEISVPAHGSVVFKSL